MDKTSRPAGKRRGRRGDVREAEATRLGGKDGTLQCKPTDDTAATAEQEVESAISSRRLRRRWAESGEEDERDGGGEDRNWI